MTESPMSQRRIVLKKKLGQHLLEPQYLDEIVRLSEISPGDSIFEIGAGPGNLTARLIRHAGRVVSVEVDRQFEKELLALQAENSDTLQIRFEDVLTLDLSRVLGGDPGSWKVLANIPYYITTPILEMLLGAGRARFSHIFLTIQKELAHRICAPPGAKETGSLSHFVAYHADARILLHIPRTAFTPPPLVDSSFVHLRPRDTPPVACPPHILFPVIHRAFTHRRKTLKNSLKGSFPGGDRELADCIIQSGLNPLSRPQDISLAGFAALALRLQEVSTIGRRHPP